MTQFPNRDDFVDPFNRELCVLIIYDTSFENSFPCIFPPEATEEGRQASHRRKRRVKSTRSPGPRRLNDKLFKRDRIIFVTRSPVPYIETPSS